MTELEGLELMLAWTPELADEVAEVLTKLVKGTPGLVEVVPDSWAVIKNYSVKYRLVAADGTVEDQVLTYHPYGIGSWRAIPLISVSSNDHQFILYRNALTWLESLFPAAVHGVWVAGDVNPTVFNLIAGMTYADLQRVASC